MASVTAQEKQGTMEDIYRLPEGSRAELIDGRIYAMAPPSRKHQRIVGELFAVIREYIRHKQGSCEVDIAPFAVFLSADESKYLEPDISVICDKDKLDDRGCNGAPDWIIEVVSPGSRVMDYYTKLSLYRESGVREYWIVDPMKQIVLVYDMEHDAAPAIYSLTDTIKANIYDMRYSIFIAYCYRINQVYITVSSHKVPFSQSSLQDKSISSFHDIP